MPTPRARKPRKPQDGHPYRSPARTAPGVASGLVRLGKRVRELRLAAGLTQERAAAAANVTTRQVNLIENGKTNPTVATLIGLARGFGVRVGSFFETV